MSIVGLRGIWARVAERGPRSGVVGTQPADLPSPIVRVLYEQILFSAVQHSCIVQI